MFTSSPQRRARVQTGQSLETDWSARVGSWSLQRREREEKKNTYIEVPTGPFSLLLLLLGAAGRVGWGGKDWKEEKVLPCRRGPGHTQKKDVCVYIPVGGITREEDDQRLEEPSVRVCPSTQISSYKPTSNWAESESRALSLSLWYSSRLHKKTKKRRKMILLQHNSDAVLNILLMCVCFIYIYGIMAGWIVTIARLRRSQIRWWPTQSVALSVLGQHRMRLYTPSCPRLPPFLYHRHHEGPDRARASIHHDKWHLESLHHFVRQKRRRRRKKNKQQQQRATWEAM